MEVRNNMFEDSKFHVSGKTLHVEVGEIAFEGAQGSKLHLPFRRSDLSRVFDKESGIFSAPTTKYSTLILHFGRKLRKFALKSVGLCCGSICPDLGEEIKRSRVKAVA